MAEKRCLYEVLGLPLDCSHDEIRSAYKKLALQRHPDKLVQSGLSSAAATASFQELVNAYQILSDPRERSWYDSHRSQILFSSSNNSSNKGSTSSNNHIVPDLFSFFSNSVFSGFTDHKKNFYKVYGDVFDKIYSTELNFARKLGLGLDAVKEAPVMGNLESPYEQATAFYGYWLGFATVMDFGWVDRYEVMAGTDRKSRRVMEEENKKLRKKARREYNETVRGLAEFVRKRDKRVIDMQVRRSEEMERKREEERERKRAAARERMERARAYREPEEEDGNEVFEDDNDDEEDEKRKKELYCVVCGKKFKSEKQWKNHEQSKKHKEKVAELKEAFGDEERGEEEEGEEERQEGFDGGVDDGIHGPSDRFEGSFGLPKQNGDHDHDAQSSEEEGNEDVGNNGESKVMEESFGQEEEDDDEASVLETMLSGYKSKKNASSVQKPKAKASSAKDGGRSEDDEMDFREYNNTKGARRKRGERGRRYDEEAATADRTENSDHVAENNGHDDGLQKDGTLFPSSVENESNDKGDDLLGKGPKVSKQPVDRKANVKKDSNAKKDANDVNAKKDVNAKSKNSSKGRKQKATSKASGTVCDTCGEDFESRNRLHKHLGDTGHASLKSR